MVSKSVYGFGTPVRLFAQMAVNRHTWLIKIGFHETIHA